jgi:FkbM family methyltransferase
MERQVHLFDNGIRVYDDHLIAVQRERYRVRNVHEAEEEDIFAQLIGAIAPEGCFVNIGAAIGYYVLLAKRLAPALHVHAVEPLERHRRFLAENLALNGIASDAVTVHPQGISGSTGTAQLKDRGYSSSIQRAAGARGGLAQAMVGMAERIIAKTGVLRSPAPETIQTITLDALCVNVGRNIDLCQMDVQGLELDVLRSGSHALQGGIKQFLIGTHSLELHRDCRALLQHHGYSIDHDEYETKDQPDGILAASK